MRGVVHLYVTQDLYRVGMSRVGRQTGETISDNLIFRGIFAKGTG